MAERPTMASAAPAAGGHLRILPLALLAALAHGCAPQLDPVSLEEHRRAEGSEVLLGALGSEDPARRARAALAMGRIQSPSYVGPLVRTARADQGEARAAALFALGQLALASGPRLSRSAFSVLAEKLEYADAEIVALALEALGKLGEPPLGHRIHPFVHHASERVRAEAVLALLRSRFLPVWRDGADPPPALPPPAVAALVAALADPAESVRVAATATLARAHQPEATAALIECSSDPSPWVRLFAARALGLAGDRTLSDRLVRLADDPSEQVRAEAIAAIASLGGADLLPRALESDAGLHVRAALARALERSSATWSDESLRRLERDAAPTVRAAAIASLATRLGAAYLPDLERHFAATSDWPIRVAAVQATRAVGGEARGLVERALADPDARVVASALEALGRGGEAGSPVVRQALAAGDPTIRGTAVEVFGRSEAPDRPGVLRGVYDASAGEAWIGIRSSIVEAVARLEGGRGLIAHAAQDPARAVRDRAEAALRALNLQVPPPRFPAPEPPPWLARRWARDPRVRVETTKGTIEIDVLAGEAPAHAASFVRLVRERFYDGLVWHRVVPNFVIQGGDPLGSGWGGPGYALRDEINRVRFERGTVGMAHGGRDSGGSQWFVTQLPAPHLDGRYTAFGRVVSGLEVVDRIEVGDRILRARVD